MLESRNFKINSDGKTDVTQMIQSLLDFAAKEKQTLIINEGIYLVGPLFVKSHTVLILERGAVLKATTDESAYPLIETRVAGIEMPWYPAILNCIDTEDVTIKGEGMIDGSGEYWWHKYWGHDTKSGMREIYDKKGLRWACDYDCMRPRNLLVQNSNNISIKEITSYNSGFWNVHILYSHDILITKIKVESSAVHSPSTDGIDIDSSHHVTVRACEISCNDDSISIKSGRDFDGYVKAIPSHHITIESCTFNEGFGVTMGSEVSGGISDITLRNLVFKGTDCGLRIKSSRVRKGYIKNIIFENITMENVKYLFHFYLDWNPNYSICTIPDNYIGDMPNHYELLTKKLSDNISNTIVENIDILNVKATHTDDYLGISRAFNIVGFKEVPISNITFKNVDLSVKEYGIMSYVKNINFVDTNITVFSSNDSANDAYDNR